MRLLVSTILLVLSSLVCFAQPVIQSNSYINANTVLFLESASPVWLSEEALTSQSGENQVWDASNWESLQETTQSYYPLDEVPVAYQLFFDNDFLYPEYASTHGLSANFEADQAPLPIEVADPFAFFRTDETGYYSTGTAFSIEGLPVVTQNEIVERILEFPLVYGGMDTSGISFLTEIPLFGAFGQSGTRISEVDGWGLLETPYGEYDVLRIRSERSITDTIYIEQSGTGQAIDRPLEVQYSWISSEVPGPVLTITVVENVSVSASLYAEDGVLSTNTQSQPAVPFFYPNPAQGEIFFNPEIQLESLTIFDMAGRQVFHRSAFDESKVLVAHLPPGVYVLSARDESKKMIREKLIIE